MNNDPKVVPIGRPTPIKPGLDVVVALLCEQLDDIPAELARHGLTAAERDELEAKTRPLVAAYRRHLSER